MFKRLERRDGKYLAALAVGMLALILVFVRFKYTYGSNTDWASQHWALPDYFRRLFYDTGNLFPNFAPNLGAGQNIYYFSYYGLFSPIILFSYLLPFVGMMEYIIASSILSVAVSVFLIYDWLRSRYEPRIAFCASFLFLCAGPLLFHSHRHIMFVNYLPFLLIAVLAVDSYFRQRGKGWMIAVSVTLLVLTSYFFSVGALVFLSVYAVAQYFEATPAPLTGRRLCKSALHFGGLLCMGVLTTGVLVLPTLSVLLTGRGTGSDGPPLETLLLPDLNLNNLLYSPYAVGLGFISILAAFYGLFSKQRRTRVLAVTMLLFCFFSGLIYLLNGTLYLDNKVMIPFLPFTVWLVADLLQQLDEGRFRPLLLVSVLALSVTSLTIHRPDKNVYLLFGFADMLCTLLCMVWIRRSHLRTYKLLPLLALSFAACVVVNLNDNAVLRTQTSVTAAQDAEFLAGTATTRMKELCRVGNLVQPLETVNRVYNADYYQATLYSSARNPDYHHFYFDEICNETSFRNSAIMSQSSSVLFDYYMGDRYLLTTAAPPAGYMPVAGLNGVQLYENPAVFPLGYVAPRQMRKSEYEALEYPAKLEALLSYAVLDDETLPDSGFRTQIQPLALCGTTTCGDGLSLTQADGTYQIDAAQETTLTLTLDEPLCGQILLLRFHVDNTQNRLHKDVSITVNGVRNRLTVPDWRYYNDNEWFEYALSANEPVSALTVQLSAGSYVVSDITAYTLDTAFLQETSDSLTAMTFDRSATGGDVMVGSITAAADGCLQFSIPYDTGFSVLVDGTVQPCVRVDGGFLGTKLSAGTHTVQVKYRAPGQRAGLCCTLFGCLLYGIYAVRKLAARQRRKKQAADKNQTK